MSIHYFEKYLLSTYFVPHPLVNRRVNYDVDIVVLAEQVQKLRLREVT